MTNSGKNNQRQKEGKGVPTEVNKQTNIKEREVSTFPNRGSMPT
jgi:hypothetical protein